jgi:hypothetical protein
MIGKFVKKKKDAIACFEVIFWQLPERLERGDKELEKDDNKISRIIFTVGRKVQGAQCS